MCVFVCVGVLACILDIYFVVCVCMQVGMYA